eukprot:scaffold1778_cov246-Pinguiococcus_pyrenoidosus.AAC.14
MFQALVILEDVLPAERAASQWRVHQQPHVAVAHRAGLYHARLEVVAVEQVVRLLDANGFHEPVGLAQGREARHSVGRLVAQTHVLDLAFLHELVKRLQLREDRHGIVDLLLKIVVRLAEEGNVAIRPVQLYEVYVVRLQSLEGSLHSCLDLLRRERRRLLSLSDPVHVGAAADLGGDAVAIARAALQQPPHHTLRLSARLRRRRHGVHLRRVQPVDAVLVEGDAELLGGLLLRVLRAPHHGAQPKLGQQQSRAADVPQLHAVPQRIILPGFDHTRRVRNSAAAAAARSKSKRGGLVRRAHAQLERRRRPQPSRRDQKRNEAMHGGHDAEEGRRPAESCTFRLVRSPKSADGADRRIERRRTSRETGTNGGSKSVPRPIIWKFGCCGWFTRTIGVLRNPRTTSPFNYIKNGCFCSSSRGLCSTQAAHEGLKLGPAALNQPTVFPSGPRARVCATQGLRSAPKRGAKSSQRDAPDRFQAFRGRRMSDEAKGDERESTAVDAKNSVTVKVRIRRPLALARAHSSPCTGAGPRQSAQSCCPMS